MTDEIETVAAQSALLWQRDTAPWGRCPGDGEVLLALLIPMYLCHPPRPSSLLPAPSFSSASPSQPTRAEVQREGSPLLILLPTSLGSYATPLTHRHMELGALPVHGSPLPPRSSWATLDPQAKGRLDYQVRSVSPEHSEHSGAVRGLGWQPG